MSWLAVGDWAEEMSEKLEKRRTVRLKVAAKHFDVDPWDIVGDREAEDRLLARYEAAGLSWPPFDLNDQ